MTAATSVDFSELLQYFKTYLAEERHCTPDTIRAYQTDATTLARACRVLSASDLCQVTKEQIQSYLDLRKKIGHQMNTVARIICSLRQLGCFLTWWGWCTETPLTDILRPKMQDRRRPGLSQDEVQRLRSVPPGGSFADLRRKVIVELAYATGMRLHELVALDIDDLNLDVTVAKGTVRLRYRRHGTAKLPLGSSVIAALQPYLEARSRVQGSNPQENSAALFLTNFGTRISARGVNRDLARYAQAVSLRRISYQTLRATYARLELEQGASLVAIQTQLGLQHVNSMRAYQSAAVQAGDNKPSGSVL